MAQAPLRPSMCVAFSFFAIAFGACDRNREIEAMEPIAVAQNVEKVAESVRQKAKATEKAEGKQDLVKDKVSVKKTAEGKPVIEQTGEASSYGRGFEGKKTASGEKFDKNDLTAAHPTLPMGTEATVTNLENGKSVDVRINDRGPYVKGRDIDVSQGAAKELDMHKNGVAPVKIEAKVPASEKSSDAENSPAAKGSVKSKK